jgi:hypothetical protein
MRVCQNGTKINHYVITSNKLDELARISVATVSHVTGHLTDFVHTTGHNVCLLNVTKYVN